MRLFRRDDHNAAMRRCLDALTSLMDDARKPSVRHARPLDDDDWQALVRRGLETGGAGVFLWGFLEVLAAKDVRTWEIRANVIGRSFDRTFGHETARAVFDDLPSSRHGVGTSLFIDGQKAGRRYLKGDSTGALYSLIGLLRLPLDEAD